MGNKWHIEEAHHCRALVSFAVTEAAFAEAESATAAGPGPKIEILDGSQFSGGCRWGLSNEDGSAQVLRNMDRETFADFLMGEQTVAYCI